VWLLAAAGAAAGQSVQPEPVSAPAPNQPLMFGNLQVSPSLAIRDIGIDSNVYNASTVVREDFTYTVAPHVKAETPFGNARLVGTGGLAFVFFHTSKDQQSLNGSASGLVDVPKGRIRPSVQYGISRSRQRSGDIDVRALSRAANGRAGLDVGLSGITSVTGWVARDLTRFDDEEVFRGAHLASQLDRTTTTFAGGARLDLTPLTSVVAAAEFERTRFTAASFRDADSLKIAPSVRFAEGAIINGQASLGFRDFRPLSPMLFDYRGLIASGDLRFTVLSVTRITVQASRDLNYSFDESQPYYMEAGARTTVSHHVTGPVDAIGLVGRYRRQYETRTDVTTAARFETITTWGGGVGVRVDDSMRFTFTVDRERRLSTVGIRQYDRTRAFAAVEYVP
jgi:hypothetical protein